MPKSPIRYTSHDKLSYLIKSLQPVIPDKKLIRFGPDKDGGYLVPDDLDGIKACFSPGVSEVSGFEKQCANLGMKVFLADASVEKPAEEDVLFHFEKKFIGVTSGPDFMSLDDWVNKSENADDSDLMLQMDIEGFEYEVFLSVSNELMNRFRIIVVEFHDIDHLWINAFYSIASRTFEKILQTHACVHIHPNNHSGIVRYQDLELPRLMEFTFARKDRVTSAIKQTQFPNPLDCDNVADKPTLKLPDCWYK